VALGENIVEVEGEGKPGKFGEEGSLDYGARPQK
jgi:hypothetical protein